MTYSKVDKYAGLLWQNIEVRSLREENIGVDLLNEAGDWSGEHTF